MAKPPEKQPPPSTPPPLRVLPMALQVGDRLVDETGEYEVIARPYKTAAGKTAHVRVRRVDNATITMVRTWRLHEGVVVVEPAIRNAPRRWHPSAAAAAARMNLLGLALNFLGSVLLGIAGAGLAAGYGGAIVWKNALWHVSWWLGWLLLALGFALQLIARYHVERLKARGGQDIQA